MLTTLALLLTNQLVEIPLQQFKDFAEPRTIAAVALSPDAHTVSVWTRWSAQTPCLRWTVAVQTGATQGFGEDTCPAPALPTGIHCDAKGCSLDKKPLGEVALQGIPTRAQLTVHPVAPVIALNFERSLTFVSSTDGQLISSFAHAGFAVRGVAASETQWLLWTQSRDGADHLYLADPDELLAPKVERPLVRPVARIRLPSSFGWKKDSLGTPDSPCDFFERGVMAQDDLLFLDWPAANPTSSGALIELRVRGRGGQLRAWRIDVAGGTPTAGLQIDRVHLAKQARWRLRIKFPFPIDALALTDGGKPPRLRPIAVPMSTLSSEPHCVFVDAELQPERFMLDPFLR